MPYSPREYAEMYYYYGAAQGNAREAARMYQEQLIRRGGIQPQTYPDYRVFLRVRNAYTEGRIPGTSCLNLRECRAMPHCKKCTGVFE